MTIQKIFNWLSKGNLAVINIPTGAKWTGWYVIMWINDTLSKWPEMSNSKLKSIKNHIETLAM